MRAEKNTLALELPTGYVAPVDAEQESELRRRASYAAERLGLRSARNAQILVWMAIVELVENQGIVIPGEAE